MKSLKLAMSCLVAAMALLSTTETQAQLFNQPGTSQPPAPPAAPPKAAAVGATAAATPAPGTLDSVFNSKLPEAIGKSKISVNARLRYEFADQDGAGAANLRQSDAFTLRTRLGWTTAPLYGFQAMVEGENISVLGPQHNFNAAGSNPGGAGKTIIADPPTTELNQAWVSYSRTGINLTLKAGRQRIALDNHRFVGDVGWRQNMQTFDAATAEYKPVKDFSLTYGYIWEVKRVFGDLSTLPAANRDFDSDSHLVNLSYSGWKYGKFVGYSYLLGLKNPAGAANSSATYGGYFAGGAKVSDQVALNYRAELAWQTDYKSSPQKYEAPYYNFELGLAVKPVAFGVGYEVLGTDSNAAAPGTSVGFRTPLATLHAFNGWADLFLNTPAKGLHDIYTYAQVTLPYQIPVRLVYHKFDAASGGADFGQEFDIQASKKLGKYWTILAKAAHYDGKAAAPPSFAAPIDVDKVWLQLEFAF